MLAGSLYPNGIPIVPEAELPTLVREKQVDLVVLSYSDLPHVEVMHKGSIALAAGASFLLPGPKETELRSSKPVVSICAVRTGAGKSPLTRFVSHRFREQGRRVVVVRHPMPYGDLAAQAVQRFATMADLETAHCTIEEREEDEPHISEGVVVFAGVDYERILRAAEAEADIVLWDGGNNDLPFYVPDLQIVVADPHRAGHELNVPSGRGEFPYRGRHRGKQDRFGHSRRDSNGGDQRRGGQPEGDGRSGGSHHRGGRPGAPARSEGPRRGGRANADARWNGLRSGDPSRPRPGAIIVDPRKGAVGTIARVFADFPHLDRVLPAMGYSPEQIHDLEATIRASDADVVLDGSPVDLSRLVKVPQPIVNVHYNYADPDGRLGKILDGFLAAHPLEKAPARKKRR